MLVAVQLGVRWEDAGVSVTACHVLQDVSVDKMKTLTTVELAQTVLQMIDTEMDDDDDDGHIVQTLDKPDTTEAMTIDSDIELENYQ